MQKLVVNMHDKTEYVVHIRNLKQAVNHCIVLKKVHKSISFNQDEWLKHSDLRKTAKNKFEKDFLTV